MRSERRWSSYRIYQRNTAKFAPCGEDNIHAGLCTANKQNRAQALVCENHERSITLETTQPTESASSDPSASTSSALISFVPCDPCVPAWCKVMTTYLVSWSLVFSPWNGCRHCLLYCEFRLCMTPADSGGAKGVGLCPYPYQLFTKGVFQWKKKTKISFFLSVSPVSYTHLTLPTTPYV